MSIEKWIQFTSTEFDDVVCSLKYFHTFLEEDIKNRTSDYIIVYTTKSEEASGKSGLLCIINNMCYSIPENLKINSLTSQLSPDGKAILTGNYKNSENSTNILVLGNILEKFFPGQNINLYENVKNFNSQKLNSDILAIEWYNNYYYAAADSQNIYIYKYNENGGITLTKNININKITNCIKWKPNNSNPDKPKLVAGGDDNIVRIIDIFLKDDSKEVPTSNIKLLEGHMGSILSIDWINNIYFNDGLIASSSKDGTIRIWNPLKNKCLHVISIDKCHIKSVSWSPYGNHILSANNYEDGTCDLKIWRLNITSAGIKTSELVSTINVCDDNNGIINMAQWNNNGEHIAFSVTAKYHIFDKIFTRNFINVYRNPDIREDSSILSI
jgi:WD40 repeat protein